MRLPLGRVTRLTRFTTQINVRCVRSQSSQTQTVTQMFNQLDAHLKLLREYRIPEEELKIKELVARPSAASYRKMTIPLSTDERMRSSYISANGTVRFGKILEDLDNFAAYICYSHNREEGQELDQQSSLPRTIVTGSIPRIHLKDVVLDASKDICVDGKVTWTGNSSMECTMRLFQEGQNGLQHKFNARFTMVSRYVHDNSKSVRVHPLKVRTPEEAASFSSGGETLKARIQESKTSVINASPPTMNEMMCLHEIFQNSIKKNNHLHQFVLEDDQEYMDKTRRELCCVCFPENQNVYGTIFGGFLMRKAYELAYSTGIIFSKTRVSAVSVDDIVFRSTVDIGNILILKSQVTYTFDKYMQLTVTAEVFDVATTQIRTTNTFDFTLETVDGSKVSRIVPKYYEQFLVYIHGKRHLESTLRYVPKQ